MDFALIKEHPWWTAFSVLAGAFLLYVIFKGRGSSGGSSPGVVYAGGQSDPAALQANTQLALGQLGANVQQSQISASLAALQIQSDTALKAKTLDVSTSIYGIMAGQDVTNRQTDATLQLGLGAQSAQVEALRIQAGAQKDVINAIVGAYGGTTSSGYTAPTTSTPYYSGTPGTMNGTNYPQVQGTVTQQPTVPLTSIGSNTVAGQGYVVPGGTQLVSQPNYVYSDPSQYPDKAAASICSPLDAYCVTTNVNLSNQYHQDVANAQVVNNLTQTVSDYQKSVTAGTITPSQSAELAMYEQQLVAAGGVVPDFSAYSPGRPAPTQVNTY